MGKRIFKTQKFSAILKNAKIGESGFVLINPYSFYDNERRVSFLTKNKLFLSPYLVFFKTIEQAERYRKASNLELLVVLAVKRINKNKYDIDTQHIGKNVYFSVSSIENISREERKNIFNYYIIIHDIIIQEEPQSIDEFIYETEKINSDFDEFDNGSEFNSSDKEVDELEEIYSELYRNPQSIKDIDVVTLKQLLQRAQEYEDYKFAGYIKNFLKKSED